MRLYFVGVVSTALFGNACLDQALPLPAPPPPALPALPQPHAVIDALTHAVFDKLECEEFLRPSTLTRIRKVLEHADVSTVQALLLNPQDLASVVALGGMQLEAPVVVGRNLWRIVESGAAADLLHSGWDGVGCGDTVALSCTAGAEASSVSCDVDGHATAIHLTFNGCALGGTIYDGAVDFTRLPDNDAVAELGFGDFTLDEIHRLDGVLTLGVGAGPEALLAIDAPAGFSVLDHGGLASGLECAAETNFETVAFAIDDDRATGQMTALRIDPDVAVGIETFGDHLLFGDACACPLPGSGAFVDVPRPLGRDGESARARITWQASTNPDLCSQPTVELQSWPTDCASLKDVDGDCAKAATEATVEALLGALCGAD